MLEDAIVGFEEIVGFTDCQLETEPIACRSELGACDAIVLQKRGNRICDILRRSDEGLDLIRVSQNALTMGVGRTSSLVRC